jgi:hypothetical protein
MVVAVEVMRLYIVGFIMVAVMVAVEQSESYGEILQ